MDLQGSSFNVVICPHSDQPLRLTFYPELGVVTSEDKRFIKPSITKWKIFSPVPPDLTFQQVTADLVDFAFEEGDELVIDLKCPGPYMHGYHIRMFWENRRKFWERKS